MNEGLILSVVSLSVAIISAVIAYVSVREQRHLTTNVASYGHLAAVEMLLEKNPELLTLHGIDTFKLDAAEVSPVELVYLAQSFSASDLFHRLNGDKRVQLTSYRMNLLRHPKVQTAWKAFIRERFVSSGPFSDAVDRFVNAVGISRPSLAEND
jgi:hypothetical protein